MDERWDNDLKKRISEVFDNYDDTSADEGWQRLREKFPAKKKSRIAAWIWLGSAAALVLLALGLLLVKSNKSIDQQFSSNKQPAKQHNNIEQTPIADNHIKQDDRKPAVQAEQAASNSIAKNNKPTKTEGNSDRANIETKTKSDVQKALTQTFAKNSDTQGKKDIRNTFTNSRNNTAVKNEPGKKTLAPEINGAVQTPVYSKTDVIANQSNTSKVPDPKTQGNVLKTDTAANISLAVANNKAGVNMKQEQAKKMNDMFTKDAVATNHKTETKIPSIHKLISLGVYAATYFNYARGSNNQFNVGAGLTSDIRISNNLKISTGISVGQNSLSYTSQAPAVLSPSDGAPLAAASFAPASKYLYTASTPQFKSYDANLIGLDVPLNIKYVFDPGKSSTYILAGVSSGTFINETYTYSYNNPSLYSSNVSQVQNQSTTNNFNGFYFARTLNLAFGTGYKVGQNRLVVEPFLKYPLEGLGTQQLKFGAGGVNLKFNFEVKKK